MSYFINEIPEYLNVTYHLQIPTNKGAISSHV